LFPTAVHARSPEHETAARTPNGTAASDWIDQVVPFQSSISGLESELPTAKQTFGHGQETPFSELKVEPGGLGVDTICQLLPSQRSATVAAVPPGALKVACPTAMHESADAQSTALRLVELAPSTFGVGGTVHAADAAEGVSSSAAIASKTR
jgi:hypothetical protein